MNQLSARERNIIRRVKEARLALGLSQEAVGQALGLTKYGYGHYEREEQPLGVDQVFALSRLLHRSVAWLLGLETGLSAEEDELLSRFRGIQSPAIRGAVLRSVRDQEELDRSLREEQ